MCSANTQYQHLTKQYDNMTKITKYFKKLLKMQFRYKANYISVAI